MSGDGHHHLLGRDLQPRRQAYEHDEEAIAGVRSSAEQSIAEQLRSLQQSPQKVDPKQKNEAFSQENLQEVCQEF